MSTAFLQRRRPPAADPQPPRLGCLRRRPLVQGRGTGADYVCGLGPYTIYSSGHPAPNSGRTDPFGLIKSRDDGRSWQKLGLEGESDSHLMAAGHGTNAVYVFNPQANSRMRDAGQRFERLVGGRQVLAVSFDLDGEQLWFSSYAGRPSSGAWP